MNCTRCKKCKKDCGCPQGYTTANVCATSLPVCANPDPCTETFNAACIVYMGDEIVDLGIKKGDRMDLIIQKLALMAVNPGCALPTSGCNAVLGLATTSISSSIINLTWLAAIGALNYSVEYRQVSSLTWLVNPTLGPTVTTDYITGLAAATEYYIRVNAICSVGNCYSLTIKVKTKSV